MVTLFMHSPNCILLEKHPDTLLLRNGSSVVFDELSKAFTIYLVEAWNDLLCKSTQTFE